MYRNPVTFYGATYRTAALEELLKGIPDAMAENLLFSTLRQPMTPPAVLNQQLTSMLIVLEAGQAASG